MYVNQLPADHSYVYGEDRPFAPSLAVTESGGALGAESLAGSETCGSAGCYSQILEEWKPSTHRYAAMDPLFQKVQSVMAEENVPESTGDSRYYLANCLAVEEGPSKPWPSSAGGDQTSR